LPSGSNFSYSIIGVPLRSFDQSGVSKIHAVDFKGNPLETEKVFAKEYRRVVKWNALDGLTDLTAIDSTAASSLLSEPFKNTFQFDALNRPTEINLPDQTEYKPTYNKANLLEKIEAKVRQDSFYSLFVSNIDYNEKGQREKIEYANGSQTTYSYETETFRLSRMLTTRNSGSDILQDCYYTYDPVGNITEIRDNAQQTHYFKNAVVFPLKKFEYTSLYSLKKATGREHAGGVANSQYDQNEFPVNTPVPHVNNKNAVRNYTQQYRYDEVGNILQLIHTATGGSWTRNYGYETTSNRLRSTSTANDDVFYSHDVHSLSRMAGGI